MVIGSELKDHDPDDSPLLVLSCDHAWTVETLDKHVGFKRFYLRSEDDQRWVEPRVIEGQRNGRSTCPQCRAPIKGVKRYGRALKSVEIDLAQRNFIVDRDRTFFYLTQKLNIVEDRFVEAVASDEARRHDKVRERISKIVQEVEAAAESCVDGMPTRVLHKKEQAFLRSVNMEATLLLGESTGDVDRAKKELSDALGLPRSGNGTEVVELTTECYSEESLGVTTIPKSLWRSVIQVILLRIYTYRLQIRGICNLRGMVNKPCRKADGAIFRQDPRLRLIQKLYGEAHEASSRAITICLEHKYGLLVQIAYEEACRLHSQMVECLLEMGSTTPTLKIRTLAKAAMDRFGEDLSRVEDVAKRQRLKGILDRLRRREVEPFFETLTETENADRLTTTNQPLNGSGQWYQCPNGHLYTTGSCEPKDTSECCECG